AERFRIESDGDLSQNATNGGDLVFNRGGKYVQMAAYVPTMAATPAINTNMIAPGLSIIPTAAANTAAYLGPSTPVPGQQVHIYNKSGQTVRIEGAGTATLNGGSAGTYIAIASAARLDCETISTGIQTCPFYSVNGASAAAPTPARP